MTEPRAKTSCFGVRRNEIVTVFRFPFEFFERYETTDGNRSDIYNYECVGTSRAGADLGIDFRITSEKYG